MKYNIFSSRGDKFQLFPIPISRKHQFKKSKKVYINNSSYLKITHQSNYCRNVSLKEPSQITIDLVIFRLDSFEYFSCVYTSYLGFAGFPNRCFVDGTNHREEISKGDVARDVFNFQEEKKNKEKKRKDKRYGEQKEETNDEIPVYKHIQLALQLCKSRVIPAKSDGTVVVADVDVVSPSRLRNRAGEQNTPEAADISPRSLAGHKTAYRNSINPD